VQPATSWNDSNMADVRYSTFCCNIPVVVANVAGTLLANTSANASHSYSRPSSQRPESHVKPRRGFDTYKVCERRLIDDIDAIGVFARHQGGVHAGHDGASGGRDDVELERGRVAVEVGWEGLILEDGRDSAGGGPARGSCRLSLISEIIFQGLEEAYRWQRR
jgi:hypothetical protein